MQENGNSGENQKELLGIKDPAIEMKAFRALSSGQALGKRRVSESEDMSMI